MTTPIPFPKNAVRKSPPPPTSPPPPQVEYAELQCVSNFSFLRGGSHPAELVEQAKALGLTALGIADRNTVAGVVRAHAAARETAKQAGLQLLVGARIDTLPHGFVPRIKDDREEKLTESHFADAPPDFSCIIYPSDRAAWGRLCRLLSNGKMKSEKGECHLRFEDLEEALEGQMIIAVPPQGYGTNKEKVEKLIEAPEKVIQLQRSSDEIGEEAQKTIQNKRFEVYLERLNRLAPGRVWLAANILYHGDDRRRLNVLNQLADRIGLPLVATNDVHYHHPERRPLQDVISCIREKCTLETAGFKLLQNAERHLKPGKEMVRLFTAYPEAVKATQEIASRCTFCLDELSYHYPNEPVPQGKTAQQHLEELTWAGAKIFYPEGLSDSVRRTLKKELQLIERLGYAQYFLTVHDIVAWARKQGILCQGRGSAANSAVCYCLGVTAVDPSKISLLFERFLSEERREPPDIDVDFEHERREEVIQYIYRRYGRHRAAIAATIITYRPRSAVREVGKVMGLTEDITTALASTVWGSWGKDIPQDQIKEAGLDISDPHLARTIQLTQELLGFPRHLSQHVGGFILTEDALVETVPVGNAAMEDRTFIEWDKDDIDELKIMKVDVLALGMLSCIRKCFDLIRTHYRQDFTLANLPKEDEVTYAMLQRGDSLGTFQVESRAQMNMLPRLKPARFYDLVIQVAIVRPGPIQGDMVHPYLRRRDGIEEVIYPSPAPPADPDELRNILGRTLGVPLFQEQAMQIAIDAAKFTPEEANLLRKAMATFRRAGTIHTLQEKMVGQMIERGYDPDFSRRCFEQIKGFGEYGFPESHAASFALLVYVSSWLKCHYPDVFCAGLLNAQPMGFYAPAQIVRDAKEHGIEVRPIDINHSAWDNTLEENHDGSFAVRLGFRQADGLREEIMLDFVEERRQLGQQPFTSLDHIRQRSSLTVAVLERLAANDAFRSIGLDRRQALWAVRGLASDGDVQLPLFTAADERSTGPDIEVQLPVMRTSEHVVNDYQTHRLSLKAHPLSFLRAKYRKRGMIEARHLFDMRQKQRCSIAGVVLVRQRPGTAKGVVFMTIEDETGVANIVVWKKVMERFRKTVMGGRLVRINGEVQRAGDVIHVVAHTIDDLTADLDMLSEDELPEVVAHADHMKSPLHSRRPPASRPEFLANADEVKRGSHGEEYLRMSRAERQAQDKQGLAALQQNQKLPLEIVTGPGRPKREAAPNRQVTVPGRGSHPRNVRVIPKSRDFH
ncbi:MAG: error-prone DNA polymerase [Rhizobiaceae bacterium]